MAKSEPAPNNVIEQVKGLLNEDRPDAAMKILGRSRDTSTAAQNARAVCLMRLGQAEDALRILNPLVFPRGGLTINADAPVEVKINYATALLMSGNLAGCLTAMGELKNETHPSVGRLRRAIAGWRKSQSLWRRLALAVGMFPADVRIQLDFRPGEL